MNIQSEKTNISGNVFIASMNMRGKWADIPNEIIDNCIKVNVTSSQSKTSKNRIEFSPMTEIKGSYKGFWNFESYWQSGKVFENIPIEKTKKYWKELKEPKRRYPNSKGKKVLFSYWDEYSEKMDYITSRKKVYVPEYYNLIKNKSIINYYKEQLKNGKNIIVYDFDGPRLNNKEVTCIEINKNTLIEKINDVSFPFGHGYIVASEISGININEYIN